MGETRAALSPEYIALQRKRLDVLHAQISGGEERTIENERAALEVLGDEPDDAGDRGGTIAQYEVTQALHDVDKRRLSDIERAIRKIEEGTYGLSDLSGIAIPKARLMATPEAILTVQEEEQRQKDSRR